MSIKEYLLNRVKSPLFIIAGIFIVFFILISIFPQIITPYSYEELTGYLTGSWELPSSDHPLGTASFGRDVLGRTVWGIRDALIFGFGAVLIGLIGGLIFGYIKWTSLFIRSRVKHSVALMIYCTLIYSVIIGFVITLFSYLIFGFTAILIGLLGGLIFGFIVGILSFIISRPKRSEDYTPVDSITMGSLIIFSILPGLVLILISLSIYGRDYWLVMAIIGILLIPFFTRAISNVISRELNLNEMGKTIISHIPLGFAIAIILYEAIGYLGFSDPNIIQLSSDISAARLRLDTSPLASFSPGIAITWIVMSFLLLHIALQDYGPDFRE